MLIGVGCTNIITTTDENDLIVLDTSLYDVDYFSYRCIRAKLFMKDFLIYS